MGTFTSSSTVSSGQTAAGAGQILSGYSAWVNGAEVKGNIASKTSSDMTVNGKTVTAPAGYYSSAQSKSVADGKVTAPSSISGSSATVTTGSNTLTLSKTISVTPSVTTAGYVSSGTAGNSSVSLTASVTTKAATTYTPTTSDQTIASGTYLTGAQTIKGDANLKASNIASGVTIFGIEGTHSGGDKLVFTNKTVALNAWVQPTNNTVGYGEIDTMTITERWRDIYKYRASITCTGALNDMFAYVEFSDIDSVNGYFAPFVESYDGGVYIYAVEPKAVTINTITFYKG